MASEPTVRALRIRSVELAGPIGIDPRVRLASGERLSRKGEGRFVMVALRNGRRASSSPDRRQNS
jgi:hypothetical protein